ncbi:hypothetical protein CPB85DRAFT_1445756 [Mucidula mucida]|nr:hypothetical protein CPB85DRAFT_1445756 [Mucidula mucida]
MLYAPPLHMYGAASQYHYPYYDPTTDDWDIAQWQIDTDAKTASSPESPTTSPTYEYLFDDSDPELDSPSSSDCDSADEWLNAWLEWNPTSSPGPLPPLIELPEIDEDAEDADLLSAFPEPPKETHPMAFYPENYIKRRRAASRASLDPTLYPREIRNCIDRWMTMRIEHATGTVRLSHPSASTPCRRLSSLYPQYIFVDAYDAIASLPDLVRELDPRDLPPEVVLYHGRARWLIMREASWYIRAKIHRMEKKMKTGRNKKKRREASVNS